MKNRPILFNGEMVRAILSGQKTQTRRVAKEPPVMVNGELGNFRQFGDVGDQLWVRETWRTDISLDRQAPSNFAAWPVEYKADGQVIKHGSFFGETNGKTRVSIHMPRWASRITLEITGVRVERLNNISEADSMAEGCPLTNPQPFIKGYGASSASGWYSELWESINGAGSWAANPWVWVVEFKRVEVKA